MAENSAIEWTDHTFNPWEGCQKVGPGCDHCYAETRNARYGGGVASNWGPGAPRRRTSAANWRKPLAWQRDAARFMAEHGRRQRVFCASLADWADNAVDPAWRADLFALIRATPDLDWLLLTKRIGNADEMAELAGGWPENVWLGATIVSQHEAYRDIPTLLMTGACIRFLSMEPLLGPVDLSLVSYTDEDGDELHHSPLTGDGVMYDLGIHSDELDLAQALTPGWAPTLDWIIVGGESGPGARPMHPDWARSLRDQCAAAGVPFLFKQWGEHDLSFDRERDDPDWRSCDRFSRQPGQWLNLAGGTGFHGERVHFAARVGKKRAGRLLDGVTHDGFPALAGERRGGGHVR